VTKLIGILLCLLFAEDWGAAYIDYLGVPMAWVHDLLLTPTPISIRPFDIVMLVVLAVASGKKKGGRLVEPMVAVLFVVLATTLFFFVWGLIHGGAFRFASWQVYNILSTVLLAFAVATAFRTAADFNSLGKWLVIAASYRAFMCWLSYFTWGRKLVGGSGAYLTSHDDTINWVGAILVLIAGLLDNRSTKIKVRNILLILFFLGAIQFNSRRIAWVSLGMGLATMYALMPVGAAKRRINRTIRYILPVALLYVVVGWGSGARIFLPLKSLSTVTTQEDASTLARNAENLGLIATSNSSSLAFGTGWGRPYLPVSRKYDISSSFELWQYVPHNSILGLLAFTGVIGFAGFWLAIPTAVFLNARVAKLASNPMERNVAIVVTSQMIVTANQLYGDMGIFFLRPMYVVAIGYAVALRLPRVSGVWGAPAKPAAPAQTPAQAQTAAR
jgi:hypothetical protein